MSGNCSRSIADEERESLLHEGTDIKPRAGIQLSVVKQRSMMAVILFLQFLTLSTDTILLPFFPSIGKAKGLTHTEVGVVFSAFEISRFISFPIFGSLVSALPLNSKSRISYCLFSSKQTGPLIKIRTF